MPKKRKAVYVAPYIIQRGHAYHAVMEIPTALRAQLGKRRFMATLGTGASLAQAKDRAAIHVADWKAALGDARGGSAADAEYWRRRAAKRREGAPGLYDQLRAAGGDVERQRLAHDEITREAWAIGAENVERIGDDPLRHPTAQRFLAVATGVLVPTTEHLEEYLGTLKNAAKSVDMKRSTITKFAARFKHVRDIERRAVQRWLNDEIASGLAVASVRREVSELRGYWRYLLAIEIARPDARPFDELSFPRNGSGEDSRLPFTPAEVTKLWKAAKAQGDAELADAIDAARWTGCRIEELAALQIPNVERDYFKVVDAKTPAGRRDVPIHSKARALFKRLIGKRKDGYVFEGLSATQYGDRSGAISKRFGRLKTAMGFGPDHVLHSIRKGVATQFEEAGVAESTSAQILGHSYRTMTFGTYSGGVSLAVKRAAIEKLKYPSV